VVLADLQSKGHVREGKHFAVLNFDSFFQEKERRVVSDYYKAKGAIFPISQIFLTLTSLTDNQSQ